MTFDRLLYLLVSQSMDLIELSVIQGHTQKGMSSFRLETTAE